MEDEGREPKALENRPDIPDYLKEYFKAFYFLSGKRSVGFSSENPISTQDIVAYLELYPTENRELFTFLISEMDTEYLDTRSKTRPSVKGETKQSSETMTGNEF